jgi:hypothetical protein
MSTIVKSASLLSFAAGRRMQVGAFVNEKTGDSFKSCIFTDADNNRCFVAFSSKLGELTPKQIAAQKNDLQVVTLDSGSHILCKQGSSWEDVEL